MGKGIGNRLVSCEPEHRSPRGQCGFNPLAKASSAPSLAAIDSEYGFGLRPLSADIHQLVSWQRQVQCLSLLREINHLKALTSARGCPAKIRSLSPKQSRSWESNAILLSSSLLQDNRELPAGHAPLKRSRAGQSRQQKKNGPSRGG